MEKELVCVYCTKTSFIEGKGSKEHVILSSLGGKKSSRNICCQKCNNNLGDSIDVKISEQLKYFSNLIKIKFDKKNKTAPTLQKIANHHDKQFDMKAGGDFTISKSLVHRQMIDETTESITITANTPEQAKQKLNQILKQFGKNTEDFDTVLAKMVKTFVPEINFRINLGTEEHMRSIAKMMLTYAATVIKPDRLRNGSFDSVINYIVGKDDKFDIDYDSISEFPICSKVHELNHRVLFIASEEKNTAIGLLELFGSLRFSAVLSNNWSGPNVSFGHSINPITSETQNFNNISNQDFFNTVRMRSYDQDEVCKMFNNLCERVVREQERSLFSSIVERELNKFIGENSSHENQIIISQQIASKLIEYFFRKDETTNIDLNS